MRIDELDIHPLAQAVLRYFTVPQAAQESQLTAEQVIEHLGRALLSLKPSEIQRAGRDLLDVCRFLRRTGRSNAAIRIAREISRAAKSKLVERGASALLAPDPNLAPPVVLPKVPAERSHTPPPESQPGLLESKWDSMSERERRKLAKLADELRARLG